MSIVVEHISKTYGTQQALNAVSFSIDKGEIVGFLGPNGAGKSTLMKILTGYIPPTSGNAKINGFEVSTEKIQMSQHIGYLPEHNPQYLEMYVREYLAFNAKIHHVAPQRIEEVIQMTGLMPEANKKISQLSKGYRQRVGLAAALLHDPEVLILDEPTTGLDPNQLVEIRQLIKTIGKEKTILLSTHIMQEVEAICDRAIIIKKGNLVADKTLSDLRDGQEQRLIVEFDLRVEIQLLQRIRNIKTAQNTDGLEGFVYDLVFESAEDMRAVVFDFAKENELKILQLERQSQNLEKLFQELTA